MTLDDLVAFGANVEEGLSRCLNNEEFYLRLVGTVKDEKGFDALQAALQANDLDAAFDSAHALKGILGNLALTPLYERIDQMTELLRARTQMDYTEQMGEILKLRDQLVAL